jgi:EpsD family peptidyl-prolyl cis-trans isomerase
MISNQNNSRGARFGAITLAVVAVFALSACQKKEGAAATQVAAKVNGDEITVHQIEFALRHQRGMQPNQALEKLIDQQLEVQKAEQLKLDRDPQVMQLLEAVRRDILAQEYLKTIADKTTKPSDDEVKNYYAGHAAMFADRKTFNFERIDIQAAPERRAEVAAKAQDTKSLNELTDWLKAQNLKYNVAPMTLSSEQMVGPMADKVLSLKEGQSAAQPVGTGVVALTLQSTQAAPKSLEDARAQIEMQLANETRRNAVTNAAKDLRRDAKIEYVGSFAASAPSASGSAPAAAPAASEAATPAPAAAPTPAPASAPASGGASAPMDADTLKKGLNLK